MKELNKSGNLRIPYNVRLKNAAKVRDMSEVAKKAKTNKYNDIDYSVEVFNNFNIMHNPDKIGITVFYPDSENPTHFLIGIYNIEIGEKGFDKEVKKLYKELYKKVGK